MFTGHDRAVEEGILGPAVVVFGGVLRGPTDFDQRRVWSQRQDSFRKLVDEVHRREDDSDYDGKSVWYQGLRFFEKSWPRKLTLSTVRHDGHTTRVKLTLRCKQREVKVEMLNGGMNR